MKGIRKALRDQHGSLNLELALIIVLFVLASLTGLQSLSAAINTAMDRASRPLMGLGASTNHEDPYAGHFLNSGSAITGYDGTAGSGVNETIPDSIDGVPITAVGTGSGEPLPGFDGLTGTLALPASITSIGSGAFSGCAGLTGELVLPWNLSSIGDAAFAGCAGLTQVELPTGITAIAEGTFAGCSNLTVSVPIARSEWTAIYLGCMAVETY
jgi:Flp pilus assembly pilin Flp